MVMNGPFFSNEDLYAEMILRYIRNSLNAPLPPREYIRDYSNASPPPREYIRFNLDVLKMLCKASPSNELAACLLQLVFQMDGEFVTGHISEEHFMAVCIYLFVSYYCVILGVKFCAKQ